MLGLDNMAALGAGISYHHKFCMEWMLHRDPNNRGFLEAYFATL
jgi:hypothetical protein